MESMALQSGKWKPSSAMPGGVTLTVAGSTSAARVMRGQRDMSSCNRQDLGSGAASSARTPSADTWEQPAGRGRMEAERAKGERVGLMTLISGLVGRVSTVKD